MHTHEAVPPVNAARKRCTCYLLRRLTRRVTQAYDQALVPVGLTITQYSLLAHLRRSPGASVSALAASMGIDRTTLVRNLKPVIEARWARYGERRAGRSASLELTPAGQAKLRAAEPYWSRAQDALEAALGMEHVARLHELVDETLDALKEEAGT